MLVALDHLLIYKNKRVLERYEKDHPNNTLKAEEALNELLKFFWLVRKHKIEIQQFPNKDELKFECSIHYEMREIDDMWHTFLLFTQDYMDFCHSYFNNFMHHHPFSDQPTLKENEYQLDLTRYLSYIYDNLGEATLMKWFEWEKDADAALTASHLKL